jgi:CrcB protein
MRENHVNDEPGPLREVLSRLLRNKMLLLMLGGAVGTALRYWVSRWISLQSWGQAFPLGTMVVNVSGSFVLGVAATIILERLPAEYQHWYLLIGAGFCGGYTTFSTFEWETYNLLRAGKWGLALLNVGGSVAVGFLGLILGVMLAALLFPRR